MSGAKLVSFFLSGAIAGAVSAFIFYGLKRVLNL